MLLIPDFIKAIAAKGKAKQLAQRLDGQIEKERGPSPKIFVRGKHRSRKFEFYFAISWGHASVTVGMEPKHDLYFHLRSQSDLRKRMPPGREREYSELEDDKGLFISWSRDEDRLDAKKVIAGLEPALHERMLTPVRGSRGWNFTADGLQFNHACSVFSSVERLMEALDLACDVAQGIEVVATNRGLLNSPPFD